MSSNDINWMAWFIVAEQMTRGERDKAAMVAAGINAERMRWVQLESGPHNHKHPGSSKRTRESHVEQSSDN